MDRLGVIGVGRMGLPIVGRFVEAGRAVTVFDIETDLVNLAAKLGAGVAGSIHELAAEVDVLVTVLPGPSELRDAMTGPDGALDVMRPGSCWLDLTSNDPRVAVHVAAAATERGVQSVGAPMAGNPDDATAGTLGFYVGGAPASIERVTPILHALSDRARVQVMGPSVADGYVTKLLANTLWFGQAIAVTEALLLGQATGLDLRTLRGALEDSAGGSSFLTHHADALLAGDYLTTFGIDRVVEELDTVTSLAAAAATPHDLSRLVANMHRDALEQFGPIDGELLAARLLEQRAGRNLHG